MNKKIVIIGGGISGLALLHYLKKKYPSSEEVSIKLLEKNESVGGTIHTVAHDYCHFETGPNGFLNVKPTTLEFINEINLSDEVIFANENAKKRYILLNGQLHKLPGSLVDFISFKLLTLKEKLNIFKGVFKKSNLLEDISLYDYFKEKFGQTFADIFIDPFVKGVYGGNAKDLRLRAVFPNLFKNEKKGGSLFKALKQIKKDKKKQGAPKIKNRGQLMTLRSGMGKVVNAVYEMYKGDIALAQEIVNVERTEAGYMIQSTDEKYDADELYICSPAQVAGKILRSLKSELSEKLYKIDYSSIAVVGFAFKKKACSKVPNGFGYLIPTVNNSNVLGVLFESNIFENRCNSNQLLCRVMVNIDDQRNVAHVNRDKIINLAFEEMKARFDIEEKPEEVFLKVWPHAIPQYNSQYLKVVDQINQYANDLPNFYLLSNYLNGISFNDCIENAKKCAENHK